MIEEIRSRAKGVMSVGIFTIMFSLLLTWTMMPTNDYSPAYSIEVIHAYSMGGIVGIIGGFLFLYGFVKLVALETIDELSHQVSTDVTEE